MTIIVNYMIKWSLLIVMTSLNVQLSSGFTALSSTGCGTTKTCIMSPSNCDPTSNCEYFLSWSLVSGGTYVDIEVAGNVNSASDYVAIAFSTDTAMGDDGATACYMNSGAIAFWSGYTGTSVRVTTLNPPANYLKTDTAADGGSYTASTKTLQCRFKRLMTPTQSQLKDLKSMKYYVMYAMGTYNTAPNFHNIRYGVSSKSYDISVTSTAAVVDPGKTLPSTSSAFTQTDCGTTKSCYSPSNGLFVSWKPAGSNMVEIELSGTIPSATGYIAVGFSTNRRMQDDAVIGCVASSSGTVTARVAYNVANGKLNQFATNVPSNFMVATGGNLGATYQSSSRKLSCRVRRLITPASSVTQLKDLASPNQYYIMVARGPRVGSGGLGKHSDGMYTVSSQSVVVSSTTFTNLATAKSPLAKAHGSLMIIAWFVCTSIGLMMAQRFKLVWGDKKLGEVKVWFAIHRGMQLSCLVLTVIAFILIFVEAKGYSKASTLPYSAHPILGIIVTILCIVNPIMALFRPHPDGKNRPIFNWAHRIVGSVAYILAFPTIVIGMKMAKAGPVLSTMSSPQWIVLGFAIFTVVIGLLYSLVDCTSKDSDGHGGSAHYAVNQGDITVKSESRGSNKKTKFYNGILALFVIGLLCFVITLIVFIIMY